MQQASKSPETGLMIAPLKDNFGAQIFDVDLQHADEALLQKLFAHFTLMALLFCATKPWIQMT